MRHFLTISALYLTASCAPATRQIEYVVPDLPTSLRTPVEVPERKAETLADVGVILTDHVQALDEANGKITATDCIWTAAQQGRDLEPGECGEEPA